MKNENRKQQEHVINEQVINEAKEYFDACGFTASLDGFFAKDMVKNLIHEKYAGYEKEVGKMVQEITELGMPEPIIERAKSVAEAETGKEEKYLDNVKVSLLLSLKNFIEAIEIILDMDDNVATAFKKSIESDDPESKIMNILREISEGIIKSMTKHTVMHMCVPEGMPDELMGLMLLLGGGMPMMNLSEMMDMFGPDEDDEDDYDDEDDEDDKTSTDRENDHDYD